MLEVGNTTATALTAGAKIPFTTVFFNTNSRTSFDSANNALLIKKRGVYKAGGNFVFTPTAAGVVSIAMYVNGSSVPTAISSFTATAGSAYTFTIPSKYIRTVPSTTGSTVPITFVVSGAGTLASANAFVYYNESADFE
jgi:hypothetical protein